MRASGLPAVRDCDAVVRMSIADPGIMGIHQQAVNKYDGVAEEPVWARCTAIRIPDDSGGVPDRMPRRRVNPKKIGGDDEMLATPEDHSS